MTTPEFMKYFNPSLGTELIVDASPRCWTRCSSYPSSSGWRKKCCGVCNSVVSSLIAKAATLKGAGKKSSCCGMWYLYLYGSSLKVITYHKPLDVISNKPTSKATARPERLQVGLQPYKCRVFYKPGANNPVDYMSRHPDPKQSSSPHHISRVNASVNVVGTHAVPPAVSLQVVQDVAATQERHEVAKDVSQHEQIKQELSVCNGDPKKGLHKSSCEHQRASDQIGSQWTPRHCCSC